MQDSVICTPNYVSYVICFLLLTTWQVEVDEDPSEATKDGQDETTEVVNIIFRLVYTGY